MGFPYTVQELENTICRREHAISDFLHPFQIPAHDDVGVEINDDATRASAVQAPVLVMCVFVQILCIMIKLGCTVQLDDIPCSNKGTSHRLPLLGNAC